MRIDPIGKRKMYFIISGALFLLSGFMILFGNLNFGIDMTGGTQSEFRYDGYEFDGDAIQLEAETIAGHRNI
jgi:preprotein translocase subunit SecF